jgi:hypothetical protein
MRVGGWGGSEGEERGSEGEEVRDSEWANEGKPEFEHETHIG